jgi:hypothetical protein
MSPISIAVARQTIASTRGAGVEVKMVWALQTVLFHVLGKVAPMIGGVGTPDGRQSTVI